ncbi:transposase, partial [Paenibacillus jilunlii]
MTIVPENMLNNLFENLVIQFVKDNLESIMRAEIQEFMATEESGPNNSRNGYYPRNLHTKYGDVEELKVPRDRQ